MTPKQRESLYVVLGYLDAYECGLCGGEEPGQHTEGCPVLELRGMVTTTQTLYNWSGVPKEVMWIARDSEKEGGKVLGYTKKPFLSLPDMWLDCGGDYFELDIVPNYPVEWQNSLEARPK